MIVVCTEELSGLELRRAVAEALGWKNIHDEAFTPSGRAMCGDCREPGDEGPWKTGRRYVPAYESDPATLAEMCAWLTPGFGFNLELHNDNLLGGHAWQAIRKGDGILYAYGATLTEAVARLVVDVREARPRA